MAVGLPQGALLMVLQLLQELRQQRLVWLLARVQLLLRCRASCRPLPQGRH
jgi:hypothetical protein